MHNFYDRQIILKDVGLEGQNKIHNTKVLIIGAGGLGHPVASYATAAGFGHISILDFDKVEESNLNRQVCFTPLDLSKFKAEVLCKKIQEQNPLITIGAFVKRLDKLNALEILKSYDLIFDCTDNLSTKFLIHDCAWILGINLVQASLFQYEGQIHCFNYSKEKDSGCLRCLWPSVPSSESAGNCNEAGIIGAVAGSIGSIQTLEGIKMVLGNQKETQNLSININLLDTEIHKIKWNKKHSCSLCSDRTRINSLEDIEYSSARSFELTTTLSTDCLYFDIRETSEYSELDKKLGVELLHRPLSCLEDWRGELKKEQNYMFICSKGFRSGQLTLELRSQSFDNCYSLYGGLDAHI